VKSPNCKQPSRTFSRRFLSLPLGRLRLPRLRARRQRRRRHRGTEALNGREVEREQHRIRGHVPAVECIEHGDAVGAGYFPTFFAATSVTALQVNSTKS
jgi:hypothetical protein